MSGQPVKEGKATPGDMAKAVQEKMLELGFVARHGEAMAIVETVLQVQKEGPKKEEEPVAAAPAAPAAPAVPGHPAAPPSAQPAPAPAVKKT